MVTPGNQRLNGLYYNYRFIFAFHGSGAWLKFGLVVAFGPYQSRLLLSPAYSATTVVVTVVAEEAKELFARIACDGLSKT